MQSKLARITLEMLRDRPPAQTLADVAEKSGIPQQWLINFLYARTNADKAAVVYVEKLYNTMTGRDLV